MPVERRLRNARLGHDAVDAHRYQAVLGEELVGSRKDPLARVSTCRSRRRAGRDLDWSLPGTSAHTR
jgi:hypothetical protein